MTRIVAYALAGALAVGSLAGCTSSKTTNGAIIGGATGAAVGAVATRSVGGAVVGGGLGALAGYFIAKNSYKCWKTDWFTGKRYRGWCI